MRQDVYQRVFEAQDYIQFTECFKSGCTRCSLCQHDNHPVVWRGNPEAKIVLVGEAPGAKEDQNGKPFSGPAGELLDKIMASIGLDTQRDMFLTNCVYCRPIAHPASGKQNYTPKKEQINRCWPFTQKLIDLINPKIIIACGGTALQTIMDDNTLRITALEGRWLKEKRHDANVFVIIHPAAVLYKRDFPEEQHEMKVKIWNYMQLFRDSLKEKLR